MTNVVTLDAALSREEYLQAQGDALRGPGIRDTAEAALAEAAELATPAIAFDWFPASSLSGGKAEVGGVVFHLGRHGDLLGPAQQAFVGLVTIGSALEERARELRRSGQALAAFMLDEAGMWAVAQAIVAARALAEKSAAERGWGVGAELAPGQLAGWAIAEQRLLATLLDFSSIGVTVTESGMLVPQKSASLMVGVGPGYESAVVESPCRYCELSETCRSRH